MSAYFKILFQEQLELLLKPLHDRRLLSMSFYGVTSLLVSTDLEILLQEQLELLHGFHLPCDLFSFWLYYSTGARNSKIL